MTEIIFMATFVFLSAYIDYEHLKDNDYIESHASRLMTRALFIVALTYNNYLDMFACTLFFASIFDTVLNLLRGKEVLHFGKTAKWDRFWRNKVFLYMSFVSLAFGVSIVILLR